MILLTGAAGFIGSNVLKALNAQGRDDIICVDDLTNGAKCQNLASRKFCSYVDRNDVFDIAPDVITAIIHMGANVDTNCTDGAVMVRDNYTFSKKLYRVFANSKYNCPFIYASTAAVYGSDSRFFTGFRELPEDENPKSPYAFSKWLFDQYARKLFTTSPITGLRFFNVYGPGEQHKGRMRSAVGTMLNDINSGRRPTLFDGSEWIKRDFIWIDDAVNVVLWALENKPRGIFNVGTGEAHSFYDVYKAVATAADYDDHPQYVDFPADLPYYQYFTLANLDNLRRAGFTDSFTTLENGVKKYASNTLA